MSEITKTYKITGKEEQLNVLEKLFETIEYLGAIGSSREQRIYVDGDGAVRMKFTDENDNQIKSNNKYGYGAVKEVKDKSYYFDLG